MGERADSFGPLAAQYERTRPGYPKEAVGVALSNGARAVADIGAGTGKLTAVLVSLGLEVVAVEPDEQMAAVLAVRLPGVELRPGRAEALPLEDASCDALFFGQSWHWADSAQAGREAARVLRAGGSLALLWNISDDEVGWVRRLRQLTGSEATVGDFRPPPPPAGFCEGHRHHSDSSRFLSRSLLIELVSTWSTVSTLPAARRAEVLAAVEELVSSEPALSASEEIRLPQLCVTCYYHRL